MTRNKARKSAARERAAVTGERYTVALRATEHEQEPVPTSTSDGVLHRLTHRVPGVPAHVEGGRAGTRNRPHRNRTHRPAAQQRPQHHGEPRVLVGWQNRVARLFGAE